MKIDRGKIKKTPCELPFMSKVLIGKLMSCSDDNQLTDVLTSIVSWEYGLSDLYHWADVLDKFDTVLEECCTRNGPNLWSTLAVDLPSNSKKKELVMSILAFLSLLAEHTYSGSIFNSTEHLATLLWSVDMELVSQALTTMYMFGDRSSFFQSPGNDKCAWITLCKYVLTVAKSWGGKEADVALVECMKDDVPLPILTTSLNFECSPVGKDDSVKQQDLLIRIRLDKAHLAGKQIGTIMNELIELHHVPTDFQFELFNKVRLIQCFAQYNTRLEYIRARVYALAFVASWRNDNSAFYSELAKELVDTLSVTHLDKYDLTKIQVAVVNTLSALISYEDATREKAIVKATSIDSPTGPLSILVRKTIHELTTNSDKDPTFFHESLIYLLVDIIYSKTGQQAIQSGLLNSLLQLVKWEGPTVIHLRIVRYAMCVISEWSELDQNSLRTSDGLNIIAKRLECEVNNCRSMLPDGISDEPSKRYHTSRRLYVIDWALFILRGCIQHSSYTDLLRRLMSGSSLPQSLENILRYGRFYGGTLFSEALEFITEYIQQNPFYLSSFQESGFSDLILNVLLKMNIPITKDVVTSIPGVFGALCINRRGMESFLAMKPFERMFTLFTSVNFLRGIRKQRKEAIEGFSTGMALLIRYHSKLRPMALNAMIGLLNEICRLGTEPKYICSAKFELTGDEVDDYEDHQTVTQPWIAHNKEVVMTALATLNGEYRVNLTEQRIRIPLHEYIKYSTKFINIFLRSTSAENIKEFLRSGGLDLLLKLLNLPNASPTEHLLATYSNVMTLYDTVQPHTDGNSVLRDCLVKFDSHLAHFNSLMNQMNCSTGSAILQDLCLCINSDQDFYQAPFLVTPTVQALSGLFNYIQVLHSSVMRFKTILIRQWILPLGLNVIDRMSKCYMTLIWERLILNKVLAELTAEQPSNDQSITKAQFVLDALSSRPPPPPPFDVKVFVRQQIQKIVHLIDQFDSQFTSLFSLLVQLSLTPLSDTVPTSPAVLASALMKLIKDAFYWQATMDDVDMRSKFCVSFIKIILILFNKTKENSNRNLYHCDQSVQEAFFELPEQMTGDIDSYLKSGGKLSNDTLNLLDSWLEVLELQTNDFTVGHSLLTFSLVGSQGITDQTEYIILTLKKVLNCLTNLWNVDMLRQFRNETFSRLLNVIANVFKSYGHVKKVQEMEDNFIPSSEDQDQGRENSTYLPSDLEEMKSNYEKMKAKKLPRLEKIISKNLTFKSSQGTKPKPMLEVRHLLFNLDLLAMNIQNSVLYLLEQNASMVCALARLLCTIAQHNESLGIGGFIRGLVDIVTKNATSIMNLAQVIPSDDKEKIKLWASNHETIKLANQVHLLAVLSAEMPFACAKEMRSDKKCHFMPKLYTLLELTVQLVSKAGDSITSMPQWLCPLILLIDQNEKNAIAYSKRQQVKQCSTQTWNLYNGHATTHLGFANKYDQFVKAYQDGHPYYRYKFNYMHYLVHFGSMNLYCEETGQCEPIFIEMEAKQSDGQVSQLTALRMEPSRAKSTIETMVALLKLPSIDASTVEAIIRTCLRLTRNHSNACHFAQLGGITSLLNLTINVQFDGIVPMTTLLIRHVYENEHVLRCSMNNEVSSFFRQSSYHKYPFSLVFQFLHSIACRDQTLTTEWIKSLVNLEGMICFCAHCVVPRQLKPEEQSEQSKELTKEMFNVLADRWANEQDTTRPRMEFVFTTTKLLAILTEMSYLCKPNNEVIFEHKYKQGRTEQITKDCSALNFIIDNMLHAFKSRNDLNFTTNVLIKLMRSSEQAFHKVFEEMDAALSCALACADSADKHRKIESICSLIEQTTRHIDKVSPSLTAQLFKMIEQSRLISKLASATDKLDLSSAYLSTSVNASLKTIDSLISFVNKMKSTNSVMASNSNGSNGNSQQSVHVPQVAAPSDQILNLFTQQPITSTNQNPTNIFDQPASPTELLFRCARQSANGLTNSPIDDDNESSEAKSETSGCIESTFCPLMHPFLLAVKSSPASNPVNVVLHYQNCRVLLTAKENKFALTNDQITVSYSRGNSVAIFHGLGCMCSMTKQVTPCSMCQWFMECCLVDGQFQFDSIDLVKAELLAHRQKIIEETEKERIKALLSSNKETPKASLNEAKVNKTNDAVSSAVPIQSEHTKESKLNDFKQQSELRKVQSSNDQDTSEMTKVPTNKEVISKLTAEPERQQTNAKQQIIESMTTEKSVVNVPAKFDTIKEDLPTPKQTTLEQTRADVVVKVTEKISKEAISLASLQLALDTALDAKGKEQIDKFWDFLSKLNTLKETLKESQPKEPVSHELEQSKDSPAKESPITNLDLTPEQRAILGDEPIPEGLDPAVLVELPDDLRVEAIEQQRQVNSHKQQQAQVKQQDAIVGTNVTGSNATQVASPIIPAAGQGEQQQQQQQPPPNDATIPAAQIISFIQSLEPMVQQQVLEEMENQLRFLLEGLENAANTNQQNNSPTRDDPDDDYVFLDVIEDSPTELARSVAQTDAPSVPMNGPQLIEINDLSSLLLLLFVKNDSIDRVRFHSVVASFCSHQPTRKWMVYSLLDILEKANPLTNPLMKDPAALERAIHSIPGSTTWKSVTIESTFGARLKVLSIDSTTNSLLILPQAANSVYGNVLDLFLFLVKTFPDFCLETSEPSSSEQKPSNAPISEGQSAKSSFNAKMQ